MESTDRIQQARNGDPEAVDAWFRAEHPEVYRLCLGFLARGDLAEDTAQDAMLHLLDRLDQWDSSRPYRTWRDTVVLNLCRDRLRRMEAHERAVAGATEEERMRAREVEGPERSLERRETQAVLVEALGKLTPREREVFVLRDLEERPTDETARALGVGESTVRSLLTLARRRLRAYLGERLHLAEEGA